MKLLRAAAPLAVLCALAVAGACGTPPRPACLKSNCSGCCDDNGECQAGDQLYACGARAERCGTCAPSQLCQSGACLLGDGGSAGPRDAGCGPGNCNGCCDSNDFCRGGNTNQQCGLGGVACAPCGAGLSCQQNACQTFVCAGCVDGTGTCQTGTASATCGADGGACATCAGNQACLKGSCTTATCGSSNCNGCCDGTQCVTAQSALKCGTGGQACVGCTSPATCQGGACTTPPPPDAGAPCGPSTCNGCCQGGVCKGGGSSSACGEAGDTCEVCVFACVLAVCFPF